jgi:hypothetical protein
MSDSNKELSGRLLDIAIAERVMRWPRRDRDDDRNYEDTYFSAYNDGGQIVVFRGGSQRSAERWSPAQNIEAAMQVVERMWESGWQVEMVNGHKLHTHIADNVSSWYVRFINNENDMNNWSAEADTLPLAICRAALTAVAQRDALAAMEQKN